MKLFMLRGHWFNSDTAVVIASSIEEALTFVQKEEVSSPWNEYTVVLLGEWNLQDDNCLPGFKFLIKQDSHIHPDKRPGLVTIANSLPT